jgi:hypothetical protein
VTYKSGSDPDAGFVIKDSGQRQEFDGGAMRDTEDGKLDYSNLFVWFEPMGTRYVEHMTKGRSKYPDPEPGVPNWSLFEATPETLARTQRSLDRHYKAYRMGLKDEDHAAAILFNLNLAEKIRQALALAQIEAEGYDIAWADEPETDYDDEAADFECAEDCDCQNGGPALNPYRQTDGMGSWPRRSIQVRPHRADDHDKEDEALERALEDQARRIFDKIRGGGFRNMAAGASTEEAQAWVDAQDDDDDEDFGFVVF